MHYFRLIVDDPDIDGIPIAGKNERSPTAAGFIPSKWESVDPEQIEAQAITTSKWDTLDPVKETQSNQAANMSDDSFDSFEYNEDTRDYDEEKRMRLREVELKTMHYQDELESGQRNLKSGWSVQQQCEHYRRKMMKKSLRELQQDSPQSSGRTSSLKRSPSPTDSIKKSKKSKRSPSPQYNRNTSSRRRSRSPGHSKRSKDSTSPSRYRKQRRSRSRSSSHSPKRFNDRSLSPSSRSSLKHEGNRRYNR